MTKKHESPYPGRPASTGPPRRRKEDRQTSWARTVTLGQVTAVACAFLAAGGVAVAAGMWQLQEQEDRANASLAAEAARLDALDRRASVGARAAIRRTALLLARRSCLSNVRSRAVDIALIDAAFPPALLRTSERSIAVRFRKLRSQLIQPVRCPGISKPVEVPVLINNGFRRASVVLPAQGGLPAESVVLPPSLEPVPPGAAPQPPRTPPAGPGPRPPVMPPPGAPPAPPRPPAPPTPPRVVTVPVPTPVPVPQPPQLVPVPTPQPAAPAPPPPPPAAPPAPADPPGLLGPKPIICLDLDQLLPGLLPKICL